MTLLCMARARGDVEIETQSDWGYSPRVAEWKGATGKSRTRSHASDGGHRPRRVVNHSIVGRRSVGRLRCKNNEDVVRSRRSRRDVRDIYPSIHRFVVRAGGPSVPSFARHRPHRSRERHRETNERTNRTNRSEANRIHDRPVPRFEIRDSRFEIRASRFERRASSVERRDPHPPPRAHRLAHTHPPAHTDPASRF